MILLPIISISFLNSTYSDSRGGQIIKVLFTNPSILLMDGSVSERMLAIEIGYRSLLLNPFGNGGGSYEKAANQVNDRFNLVNKYENQGITGGRGNRYLKETVSSFSRYSIELGLIFFFFVAYLIYYCTRPKLYSFYVYSSSSNTHLSILFDYFSPYLSSFGFELISEKRIMKNLSKLKFFHDSRYLIEDQKAY